MAHFENAHVHLRRHKLFTTSVAKAGGVATYPLAFRVCPYRL